MGLGRGFKSVMEKANRGFKHVASAAKRGHKFVSDHVKSFANAEDLARKAANTLKSREYMSNMGGSIHNFRRGELANRARQDFGGGGIMDA